MLNTVLTHEGFRKKCVGILRNMFNDHVLYDLMSAFLTGCHCIRHHKMIRSWWLVEFFQKYRGGVSICESNRKNSGDLTFTFRHVPDVDCILVNGFVDEREDLFMDRSTKKLIQDETISFYEFTRWLLHGRLQQGILVGCSPLSLVDGDVKLKQHANAILIDDRLSAREKRDDTQHDKWFPECTFEDELDFMDEVAASLDYKNPTNTIFMTENIDTNTLCLWSYLPISIQMSCLMNDRCPDMLQWILRH